jgi:hypothetical protein
MIFPDTHPLNITGQVRKKPEVKIEQRKYQEDLPVSPLPTTMLLNLDPGAEADLALHELQALLFTFSILASGAVVGRNFCEIRLEM